MKGYCHKHGEHPGGQPCPRCWPDHPAGRLPRRRGNPHLVALTCGVVIILIAGAETLFVPAVYAVLTAAFGGIMTGMALALWAEGAP